ncbi:MAG: hypothetical protein NUV84_05435, partial [Candidatus Uhrbacteria bacterium]|nr:hypothetical protein [Candidatus Uhrbacteria bacterium]
MRNRVLLSLAVLFSAGCNKETTFPYEAPVGSMIDTEHCWQNRGDVDRFMSDPEVYRTDDINGVRRLTEWNPECFTEAEISTVREALYNRGGEELREDLLACSSWHNAGLREIEGWYIFPVTPTRVGDRELNHYFQPNVLEREDDYRELLALNASCENDLELFNQAMINAGLIKDPQQRAVTEHEVIRRFYV